ncbi:MAG: hypothetical protein AMJ43_01955 [Coxiella sp. DG_40]|nr:MAG: hypothetical protein AMJ43_01955 [Coxiella sp. DG_40]
MRKYFLVFGLGLACLLTSSVFANGRAYVVQRPTSYVIPGWVIGADIGWGYLDTPAGDLMFKTATYPDLSQSHDIGDFVWGLHGGRTFDITPNMLVGAEVGYKDLGKSKYESKNGSGELEQKLTRKVTQQAIDALLTSDYYIWKNFNLFAKAGVAYVESTTKSTYSTPFMVDIESYNVKDSIWRLRPEMTLGMGYMFRNGIDVHVLYDYIYGVTETKWNGMDHENGYPGSLLPPKPRTYGSNLVIGGISYTF